MTTLTTEQRERVKALANKWTRLNPEGFAIFSQDILLDFAAALLSEFSAQKAQEPYAGQQWKSGNEYLPYHPSASHVSPAYRDGWNDCYKAATPSLRVNPVAVVWEIVVPSGNRLLTFDAHDAHKFGCCVEYPDHRVYELGVIMEADKVDELIKLRAENAAFDQAAHLCDEMVLYTGYDCAEKIRALKQPNDARIAQIEGKTE